MLGGACNSTADELFTCRVHLSLDGWTQLREATGLGYLLPKVFIVLPVKKNRDTQRLLGPYLESRSTTNWLRISTMRVAPVNDRVIHL